MEIAIVVLIGLGILLIYSAVTNRTPFEVVSEAFGS